MRGELPPTRSHGRHIAVAARASVPGLSFWIEWEVATGKIVGSGTYGIVGIIDFCSGESGPSAQPLQSEAGPGGASTTQTTVCVDGVSLPNINISDVRNLLPSKTAWQQLKDGVGSYMDGLAWGLTALAAESGLLGEESQRQAAAANDVIQQAGNAALNNVGGTWSAAAAFVEKYPAQVAGRIGSGTAVSIGFRNPYVGLGVSALAGYGNAFKAANNAGKSAVAVPIIQALATGEACVK